MKKARHTFEKPHGDRLTRHRAHPMNYCSRMAGRPGLGRRQRPRDRRCTSSHFLNSPPCPHVLPHRHLQVDGGSEFAAEFEIARGLRGLFHSLGHRSGCPNSMAMSKALIAHTERSSIR